MNKEKMILENIENSRDRLRIIPLGGVMEIGKNMTAYVYDDQILIVDAGLMFPEEEMLGVDIVIPDITFLEDNAENVLGIVLTHGHEDHIGALPYVLRRIDAPVYGTALTLGFVANKLEEHRMLETVSLNTVETGSTIQLGDFSIEFVQVAHSIPDASGLAIRTPAATVFQTADFKLDQTPLDGHVADVRRLARIGDEGVHVLLLDTTNVEKQGFTQSEAKVAETFEKIFASSTGRIIIAAFASNIHRVQQVYNTAKKFGRRVAVAGRSMAENSRIAEDLGYLVVPEGTRMRLDEIPEVPRNETVIMTTGSQGEPLSALSKMAMDEHKHIKIEEGDTVIISATPIPGNEDLVLRTVNRLFSQGADVIYEPYMPVHVSGHGNQEDIKLMVNLIRPKYIVPVHGEQRHYSRFVTLAETLGFPRERIFRLTAGDVLDTDGETAEVVGRVAAGSVMVDGLGVGDVEDVVLRDRRHMANDGVVIAVLGIDTSTREIVTGPDIFSRGFVSEEWGEELMEDGKDIVKAAIENLRNGEIETNLDDIKAAARKALAKFFYEHTHRRPMVVPIVMEL